MFAANGDFQSIGGKPGWHHFARKSSASGPQKNPLIQILVSFFPPETKFSDTDTETTKKLAKVSRLGSLKTEM